MTKLNWVTKRCGVFLLWALAAVALPAQTLTVLHSFDGTDGTGPGAGLVQGTNGNLYGTTIAGGTSDSCAGSSTCGTVFAITPSGTLTSLHSFDLMDGSFLNAALVQGTDGNLYGTTPEGGINGYNSYGTVFKITPGGALTTIYSFVCSVSDCSDGIIPNGLVEGTDGNYYGTTYSGGVNGFGTVFKITPGGTLTTLHSFGPYGPDGSDPFGTLVQGTDGDFYGTTMLGGTGGCGQGCGTVFKITPGGTLTTLHAFDQTDGYEPYAGLVQGTDGNFYGTTMYGGANGDGVVFKMTPSGTVMRLYSFCSQSDCTDGSFPLTSLVQGTDGSFYGTTEKGGGVTGICGSEGCGTLFKITPGGTLTTLHEFKPSEGYFPNALVQDTDGDFFGTTRGGGGNCLRFGCGTVFSLSVGLKPFVKTQPTAGAVGAAVNILGSNLTGATSVTFNGTPAVFTVVSQTLITTTVPAGATTGTVEVVRPNGKGLSNVPFTVLP